MSVTSKTENVKTDLNRMRVQLYYFYITQFIPIIVYYYAISLKRIKLQNYIPQ